MEDHVKDSMGFESLGTIWTQSVNDIMGTVSQFWSADQGPHSSEQKGEKEPGNETMAAMGTFLKTWQTVASAMATPESFAAFLKGSGAAPEMSTRFGHALMKSLSELQTKMIQGAARLGESVEAYNFEKIDENIFHVWADLYKTEFQKFFQVPQLGLTRQYQERVNLMLDTYHLFQANQAELLRLLCLPFQRSFGVMQEKITTLTETGKLPDDSNDYYQMWIKVLEGHFMTLFQTPEYIEALTKTISSMTHFTAAKDAVLEDMLKGLPIAKKSEMDDLEREVYRLKRRIRNLEKSR